MCDIDNIAIFNDIDDFDQTKVCRSLQMLYSLKYILHFFVRNMLYLFIYFQS